MRVTRSKAKSGLAGDSLARPELSPDDSTPAPPPDASSTPDQIDSATRDDSPLNGHTSPFESKEAGREAHSPSLPGMRDSTNIANNPFLVNDKATPTKSLKSAINGNDKTSTGTTIDPGSRQIHVDKTPGPRGTSASHVDKTPGPQGTSASRVDTTPGPQGTSAIRVDTTPGPQGTSAIRVDTNTGPRATSATPTRSDVDSLESQRKTALLPKSPANQLLSKDRQGMRSTSNKENMHPDTSASVVTETFATGTLPQGVDRQMRHAAVIHNPLSPTGDLVEVAITPVQEAAATGLVGNNVPEQTEPRSVDVKPEVVRETGASRPTAPRLQQSTTLHIPEENLSASSSSTSPAAKKAEVYIPHAKPRPMSMSFPAPKPIPKSTKPPTVSTFKLPGDETARRLKAAKAARLSLAQDKRASLAGSTATGPPARPPFKARPVPKTRDRASLGLPVRETATSRARQGLVGAKPGADSADGASTSTSALKRASTVRERGQNRPSMARAHASVKPPPTAPRQSLTTFARAQLSKGARSGESRVDGGARGPSPSVSSGGTLISRAPRTSIDQPTAASTTVARPSTTDGERPSATTQNAPAAHEGAIADRATGRTPDATRAPGSVRGIHAFSRGATEPLAQLAARKQREEAIKLAREEASKRSREMVRKMADARRTKGLGV